jgi:hypothetical protein
MSVFSQVKTCHSVLLWHYIYETVGHNFIMSVFSQVKTCHSVLLWLPTTGAFNQRVIFALRPLSKRPHNPFVVRLFELCRRTQQLSLTVHPVDGSTFGLWPLFHLRDGGKRTEMTATPHGEALRHWFLFYTTLKIMLVLFHYIYFIYF